MAELVGGLVLALLCVAFVDAILGGLDRDSW